MYVSGHLELQLLFTLCKAGLAGSAPMACGGGVVSDLFAERDRASAMALYSIGPLIGEFYVCCATSTRVHASCKALLSVPSWEVSSQNQSVYSMSSMSLSRLLALPQWSASLSWEKPMRQLSGFVLIIWGWIPKRQRRDIPPSNTR